MNVPAAPPPAPKKGANPPAPKSATQPRATVLGAPPPLVHALPSVVAPSEVIVGLPWTHSVSFCSSIVELALTKRQTTALKFVRDGFAATEGRLKNGRLVRTGQDVVRFVLESVADELGLGEHGEAPARKA